jgi:thiol-disulfide isomerase/thioredoxin
MDIRVCGFRAGLIAVIVTLLACRSGVVSIASATQTVATSAASSTPVKSTSTASSGVPGVSVPDGVPTPVLENASKPKRELFSFILEDLAGRPVKLSKWQGHPLIVDFWATWCPPCRKEIPELNAIYKKYRSQGLVVLGLSVDKVQGDGVKSVRPFAHEFKITYPILMADDSVVDATEVDNLPTNLFFNRKGEQVSRLEGRGKSGELFEAVKVLFHN